MRAAIGGGLVRVTVRVLAAVTGLVWLIPIHFALAMALANGLGCRVTESGPTPCIVRGVDIGGYLAFSGVTGWIAIALLPVMLLTVLGWLGLAVVALARRMRRRRAVKPPP